MVRISISRRLAIKLSTKISLDLYVIRRLQGVKQEINFLEEVLKKLDTTTTITNEILEISECEALEFKKYVQDKIKSLERVSNHITEIIPKWDDKFENFAICEVEELQQFYDNLCKLTESINWFLEEG